MISSVTLAILSGTGLFTSANIATGLSILLAISEVLGADPRIKSNGIVSFILIQVQNLLKSKVSK
jgi:hypothetical protein